MVLALRQQMAFRPPLCEIYRGLVTSGLAAGFGIRLAPISPNTFIAPRKSLFLNMFWREAGFKISAKSLIPLIFVYILN